MLHMERGEEMFRAVCNQRDQMMKIICNLVDAFWSAHHNHAFKADDERHGQNRVCSAGKNINSVFKGCELINTDKCKGFDCPMGVYHRRMYERVVEAEKSLEENLAERIPLDFSRIPTYDPSKKYEVSARWFARMLLLLFTEYSFTSEITKEKSEQFTNAFLSLGSIGLNSYNGIVTPIDSLKECLSKAETDTDIEDLIKNNHEIKEFLESVVKTCDALEKKSHIFKCGYKPFCDSILNGLVNNKIIFEWLLAETIIIQFEFKFDHYYCGADKAVYEDIFSMLKAVCVATLGYKQEEKFEIIQNLNDKSIDKIGYKERLCNCDEEESK